MELLIAQGAEPSLIDKDEHGRRRDDRGDLPKPGEGVDDEDAPKDEHDRPYGDGRAGTRG